MHARFICECHGLQVTATRRNMNSSCRLDKDIYKNARVQWVLSSIGYKKRGKEILKVHPQLRMHMSAKAHREGLRPPYTQSRENLWVGNREYSPAGRDRPSHVASLHGAHGHCHMVWAICVPAHFHKHIPRKDRESWRQKKFARTIQARAYLFQQWYVQRGLHPDVHPHACMTSSATRPSWEASARQQAARNDRSKDPTPKGQELSHPSIPRGAVCSSIPSGGLGRIAQISGPAVSVRISLGAQVERPLIIIYMQWTKSRQAQ